MCDSVDMNQTREEVEYREKKSWEKFADSFGEWYTLVVVLLAHTTYFMASVTMFWPSVALPVFYDPETSPIGRMLEQRENDSFNYLYYAGTIAGPLIVAGGVNVGGRKAIITVLYSLLPVSFVLCQFAKEIELFYVCRIVQGIYLGGLVSVQPIFLAQLLPDGNKHFWLSIATVFGSTGIIVTSFLGPLVPLPCVNLIIVISSTICIILFVLVVPESPYHLIKSARKNEARAVLKVLQNGNVEEELLQIERIVNEMKHSSNFDFFKSVKYIKIFLLALIPYAIQTFSGIIIINLFAELFLRQTGWGLKAETCGYIVSLYQFSTVFLTPTLLRSKLLTIRGLFMLSLSGILIGNILITFYFMFCNNSTSLLKFIPLIALIITIPSYNCGMDPLPLIMMSEIFPKAVDAIGAGLTTSIYIILFTFMSFTPLIFYEYEFIISLMFLASALVAVVGILYAKYSFVYRYDGK